eukprot:4331827-Amphidinium_carterae.1
MTCCMRKLRNTSCTHTGRPSSFSDLAESLPNHSSMGQCVFACLMFLMLLACAAKEEKGRQGL